MPQIKITKMVLTDEDGNTHTIEGNGYAHVVTTTQRVDSDPKFPVGRVEVVMPIKVVRAKGEEGTYLRVPGLSLGVKVNRPETALG